MKKTIIYNLFFLLINSHFLMANNANQSETYSFSELRTAIFEKPIDLTTAREILREIRTVGDIRLIDSLINLKKEISLLTSDENRNIRVHYDTPSKIVIDIEATITYLNLGLYNNLPNSEKCTILMNELEERLNQGEVPNAEITLLYENVTPYTPFLLNIFDSTENKQLLSIISNSLRFSNYPDLETEVLERIDKYLQNAPIFGRLTIALSRIGTNKSIKKLQKIYQISNDENVKIFIEQAIKTIEKKD